MYLLNPSITLAQAARHIGRTRLALWLEQHVDQVARELREGHAGAARVSQRVRDDCELTAEGQGCVPARPAAGGKTERWVRLPDGRPGRVFKVQGDKFWLRMMDGSEYRYKGRAEPIKASDRWLRAPGSSPWDLFVEGDQEARDAELARVERKVRGEMKKDHPGSSIERRRQLFPLLVAREYARAMPDRSLYAALVALEAWDRSQTGARKQDLARRIWTKKHPNYRSDRSDASHPGVMYLAASGATNLMTLLSLSEAELESWLDNDGPNTGAMATPPWPPAAVPELLTIFRQEQARRGE